MKSFEGLWSFQPVSPQIKSLCFVGFCLTFWCDLQRRKQLSCQLKVSATHPSPVQTSWPWPWSPGRTGFIHQPLDRSIKAKHKTILYCKGQFILLLCRYLHLSWPLMWVSCRKGCCLHLFCSLTCVAGAPHNDLLHSGNMWWGSLSSVHCWSSPFLSSCHPEPSWYVQSGTLKQEPGSRGQDSSSLQPSLVLSISSVHTGQPLLTEHCHFELHS